MKPLFIHPDKIDRYLLNIGHPDGGPKAKFFLSRGFRGDAANRLPRALMAHFETAQLVKEALIKGQIRRVFQCNLECPDGTAPCVISVWVEDPKQRSIQFVTAYPAA